jgi:hypothetical protein
MSASYALGCPEVKQYVWIGQGNGGMTTLYTSEWETMAALQIFLNMYEKHTFKFIYMDDWEEEGEWQDFTELPEVKERIEWTLEDPGNRPIYMRFMEYAEGPLEQISEWIKEGNKPTPVMMEAYDIHKRDPKSFALPKGKEKDRTYFPRREAIHLLSYLDTADLDEVQEALDKRREKLKGL